MNLVESSVVKDISEIKDFSAKKLQEYLRTIQTIMSRKRNSYFIAKNLSLSGDCGSKGSSSSETFQ